MSSKLKLLSVILLMIIAIQKNSCAQILHERKLINTPFVTILQCSDNEYIYVGTEGNSGRYENDVTLTKIALNGDAIWKKTIDWNFNCTVRDAALLSDDNIIITGNARKAYQSYPFVMKTDPNGDTLWTRYYENDYQAEKVIPTSDGGYLFAYYSNGAGLMKLNADGDSIWSKKIGEGKPFGITETAEAVYLMVDNEGDNIVLSSIDSDGEVIWKRIYGGPGLDKPVAVINASNGDDYLFAGRSFTEGSDDDFYIGLLDCFGYTSWTRYFGGQGTDWCFDLKESSNGDFIAVGSSSSFNKNGRFDFYVVKFAHNGKSVWTKTFPSFDHESYLAQHVFETSYGSFVLAGPKLDGSSPTDESYFVEFIYPTKFDISFESDKQLLTSAPFDVEFTNHTTNAEYYDFVWYFGDGESLVSNDSKVTHQYHENGVYHVKLIAYENDFGSVDSLVVKDYITCMGISSSVQNINSLHTSILSIRPNPLSTKTTISFDNPRNDTFTLRILDQNGRIIKKMEHIRGSSIELNRGNLATGIYYIELIGNITRRAKLLVE